jgi:hypothetical protein
VSVLALLLGVGHALCERADILLPVNGEGS